MAVTGAEGESSGRGSEPLTIGAVFSAHFVSHFLQVAYAPVLLLVKDEFGIGFTEAGLVFSLIYLASGLGQPVAGILVDRFGAHRLLILGVCLQSVGILAMGFSTSFIQLLPLAVISGLGNAVYHPADLSILSRRVAKQRLGRAFAIHSVAASSGFAFSPVAVGWLAISFGWRNALAIAGLFGLIVGVMLIVGRAQLRIQSAAKVAADLQADAGPASRRPPLYRVFLMPVVLAGFATFSLTGLSGIATISFGVSTFASYGLALAAASLLVASYQIGAVCGLFTGGILAERTSKHHVVAMTGAGVAAVLLFLVSFQQLPFAVLMALIAATGLSHGTVLPSRDILLRLAAPPERLGTAFGAVYAGLDFGGLVAPLIYGPLLDLGRSDLIYVVAAVFMGLSILTVRQIELARVAQSA